MNSAALFYKLFLGNLAIVGLVVAVAGVVSYRSLNGMFLHETELYQDHMAMMARESFERLWPMPGAEADRLCKRFPAELAAQVEAGTRPPPQHGLPIRVTVVAADGRVLGDSEGDPAHMVNHKTPDRPEILAALEGRPGRDTRTSETLHVAYRYVALPLHHEGQTVGVVRVAVPAVVIVQNQALIRDVLLGAAVATLAGFALVGLLVNWAWYRPLRRIAEAAGQIAAGDLEHRVPISGPGELGQLALALNEMRDSLAEKIGTITAQREHLEVVLASLRDAVIALDADGKVVLANRAAKQLFASEEAPIEGLHLQAVIRAADLLDAYNQSKAGGRQVARQMEVDVKGRPRHLDLVVAPMPAGGKELDRLIVVRDVTELVLAAAIKAEFVANASHEFRTPLATLRAAVDSLADVNPADPEDLARVAAVIDRQARRLEDLTLDLLDLHSVESPRRPLALERISVRSLVEWLEAQFAPRADEKGLALEVTAPAPDDAFTSNRRLIELILQNLVDNAIKFTPAGGRVTCAMERHRGAMRLRVSDTGCGIRREDQSRIFERFFQADSSRSGEAKGRGTGLGLAIVKHACERLDAPVTLESELGKGTTVTVLVPDRGEGHV